jgi:hypothetical protein
VTTTIKVEGADNLRRTLDRAARDLEDMRGANTAAGAFVASASSSAAPRVTGALAASVHGEAVTDGAEIGSSLVYAGPIHNGWPRHHIVAQPFIRETAARTQPTWVSMYGANIRRIVAKIRGA